MVNKLLFVGRPAREKGLCDLLFALHLLGQYEWKLTIVGELPNDIQLSRFPFKDQLQIIGAVSNDLIPGILNTHNILIVPSHYENFGNIVIEGLACGIVIIAARTGGIKNLIIDNYNGLFFEPKDYIGLATKIEYIFKHPEIAKLLSENALVSSAKYDWKNITDETIKLLKKFI